MDDDKLQCPSCPYTGDESVFDCLGACDGNVFCPQCHTEFSSNTGKIHKPNWCCLDVIGEERKKHILDKYKAGELYL